ncbi:unnamed protein product, partial [Effrenium voratum]
MLAVKPSSGYHDVAPLWLVSEASTYSHSEFKRMLWDLAKHNRRDRREFALTGGHSAILSLIKKGEIQALPPMEALYYAKETNVIERGATPGADMPAEERKEAGRIDCDEDETNAYDMSDEDWWSVFSKGANLGRKDAGYSVHEWLQHLIDLKKRDFRTITIMIFFAGERRQDDIQSQVERMAKVRNIPVSVISVDLATDDRWDLASKETFHVILQMMKGFVDIVLGGPPCATVSRARFNRQCQGPRKRESGKQMGFGYITWRYASPYLDKDKEELICGNTPKRLDVNLLRVVTGIWMHGAQLRRDVMSIPFTVYRLIEKLK